MKFWLLALTPWMVMQAPANPYGPRPAQVFFTYVGVLHQRAWRIGDECFVPLSALADFGWTYSVAGACVDIVAGDRHVKVGLRPGTPGKLVPLREAATQLGGAALWRQDTATLDVFGVVQSISLKDGKLAVCSSLAAKPRMFSLAGPSRIVLDLEGVLLEPNTSVDLPPEARAGQFKPNVVRIALDTSLALPAKVPVVPCTSLSIDLAGGEAAPAETESHSTPRSPTTPAIAVAKPPTAGPIESIADSATLAALRIPLRGSLSAPATFRRLDPSTLEISLPGAVYSDGGAGAPAVSSVAAVRARVEGGTSILTLALPRPMGVSIVSTRTEVRLDLYKPAVGNGTLAGKLIVVDPGHGGNATGARSLDGSVLEKDLTLKIGAYLAEALSAEGATVILTRKTDVNPSLKERSEIANRNRADFFISIHINSNRLANSRSGSIAFHHAENPICTLLADCVQGEVAKRSGLPSLGPESDTSIYSSGFAVLRYAKMPAILLECGFINDAHDLHRMVTEDFQRKIAEAVVQGLKVYLGDAKAEKN